MCGSMVDIQCVTAEIRRGKKRRKTERKKKPQNKNIMSASAMQGDHNNNRSQSQANNSHTEVSPQEWKSATLAKEIHCFGRGWNTQCSVKLRPMTSQMLSNANEVHETNSSASQPPCSNWQWHIFSLTYSATRGWQNWHLHKTSETPDNRLWSKLSASAGSLH